MEPLPALGKQAHDRAGVAFHTAIDGRSINPEHLAGFDYEVRLFTTRDGAGEKGFEDFPPTVSFLGLFSAIVVQSADRCAYASWIVDVLTPDEAMFLALEADQITVQVEYANDSGRALADRDIDAGV